MRKHYERVSTTAISSSKRGDEAISFADAALALAGHTVTDAHIRDLLEQCLSGQISDTEYIAQATEHIDRTRTR